MFKNIIYMLAIFFLSIKAINADTSIASEESCELNRLGPLLKKSKYPDYKIKRAYGKSYSKESVTLEKDIKLFVETSACIHAPTIKFSFIVPKILLKASSPKENLKWLHNKLGTLEYQKSYGNISKGVKKILNKIDFLTPVKKGKYSQVSLCFNETIPSFPASSESDSKDDCNGYDISLLSVKGIPSNKSLIGFKNRVPILIQNENKKIWVYGVDSMGEAKLTPLGKNLSQKFIDLKFSDSIQKLACNKVPDEIFREITSAEGHVTCLWGYENTINYRWRETKTHIYLVVSDVSGT